MTRGRANFVPAPHFFNLNMACRIVAESFEQGGVYLVGSSLVRRDYRDVDVRCIIPDEEFEKLFGVDAVTIPQHSARWSLMCSSIALYLAKHSDLPIDFQIQSQTHANKDQGERQALGIFLDPRPR